MEETKECIFCGSILRIHIVSTSLGPFEVIEKCRCGDGKVRRNQIDFVMVNPDEDFETNYITLTGTIDSSGSIGDNNTIVAVLQLDKPQKARINIVLQPARITNWRTHIGKGNVVRVTGCLSGTTPCLEVQKIETC